MIGFAAERLMQLETGAACGAALVGGAPGWTNQRTGYRERDWQTRAGTVELGMPKLRRGRSLPTLLEPRRMAETALTAVIQEAYVQGISNKAAVTRLIGALLLEQNDEWAAQRARSMTLETIAPLSDDRAVSSPALAA